jgi:hypothetical protein
VIAAAVAIAALSWIASQIPVLAAGGLLHPARRRVTAAPPTGCADTNFQGDGLTLRGWSCSAAEPVRGTIVYLHGIADNRGSAAGPIQRFTARGFDAIAYDSRAHGESEGSACTYGFFEKEDLHRVIDTIRHQPVVVIGTSLGAAVALQEAADDTRVAAIVAAEAFSDLRTVARERAPSVLTESMIAEAFRLAERDGHFTVDEVSPVTAASRIHQPVLLLHGALDVDTPPAHSRRVFQALGGPRRLMLVPGAHHNESLNGQWAAIEAWIDDALRPGAGVR